MPAMTTARPEPITLSTQTASLQWALRRRLSTRDDRAWRSPSGPGALGPLAGTRRPGVHGIVQQGPAQI